MIVLVGAGLMAQDHARVLQGLGVEFLVVGRGEKSAKEFEEAVGHEVICGGLDAFLETSNETIEAAIIAVPVDQLASSSISLMNYGVKEILVEKPAGLTFDEIDHLNQVAIEQGANIFVAYNRRFYASVEAARKIIAEDGGVKSFNFEITEWAHVIEALSTNAPMKENWFMGNTTHVVDMAFYMGGRPVHLSSFSNDATSWHSRSANFAGAGQTAEGALFVYHGNWNAPGRWSVEMLTSKHRLIFRPLEKLQIQEIGSVALNEYEIDDALDLDYKPGLYMQNKQFLSGKRDGLCSLKEHVENCAAYLKMANY